jgi:DNA-binding NarL/FixJ family response regulator
MVADDFQDRGTANKREGLTICIVSQAPTLLAGLYSLLIKIGTVGEVYTLESLMDFDPVSSRTDIMVLGPGFGLNTDLLEVLEASPDIGILFLGDDDLDQSRTIPSITGHNSGFLPLEASSEQIEAAINAIAVGLSVGMPSSLNYPIWDNSLGIDEEIIDPLTERELEVLQLLAQGMANKQIALKLDISEHTVKFHVSSVYTKLGAANRTEAVRLGVRKGLVLL